MKRNSHFLMLVLTIFTLILSACGGTTIPVTGSGGTVQTLPAAFIAVVENITGDQWTISGQTVTIDPNVVRGGPFNTGDLVKVEVVVNQDGSFTISSVETPSVEDLSTLPRLEDGANNANEANGNVNNNNNANINDNVNVNSNDNTNSNDNNASNANSNDNTNNSNDNNRNDASSNDDNDNNNENGNDNGDNDNGNDNDSSGPGSGGNDNDDGGENDNDSNDNG